MTAVVPIYTCSCSLALFFFQAEDGIRDLTVTGVQTCALPIFFTRSAREFLAQRREAQTALHQDLGAEALFFPQDSQQQDRKSTRLNSSHSQISYAVFCLKKKNN